MQSVRNVAYRSRRNGRASPVLILFVRESRTFAATRTACRSLAEEGTPRPTGEQADEDDDRRREVIDQGNRPLILDVDEEKPAEPFRDEHDRCGDAEDPSPPSAEEQPCAGHQFQGDRNHYPRPMGIEISQSRRDQHRENKSPPPEQESRHEVDIPRDAPIDLWRLSSLGLNGTHVGESTNVCGHPYSLQIRSQVWDMG